MSSLSKISIERPILASVMSVILLLLGVVGYLFLGTREYPVVDPPIVTITTVYPGASADVIASQVTKPLEESVAEANGIRSIKSVSREQVSMVTVEFYLNTDLEAAANDVRDKVAKSRTQLPIDIETPIVEKASSGDALVFMIVQSKTKSLEDVTDFVNTNIKERLQSIEGVQKVNTYVGRKRAMRLRMDPVKMAAYGLTPLDIQEALLRENVELPSGKVEGNDTEISLRTEGRLVTDDDFNAMIITEKEGAVVRFGDIGQAVMSSKNERTAMITFKEDFADYSVGINVTPQRGANSLAIVDEFNKRFQEIKASAPEDYEIILGKDFTVPVRAALGEVEETLLLAFLFVSLIIFFFLRDWRSLIIPLVAIPISIIAAFFIMYLANFSINVLTLLGMVLAIGLVVDDAIVVMENIFNKVEQGMHPKEAAHRGSSEIFFAVISTTITLAAVFIPILFLDGVTGKLFKEFVVVVAGSVLISAFVALTLTPMMSAYLLKPHTGHNWLYRKTEPYFEAFNKAYERSLAKFLKVKWVAIVLLAASFAVAAWLLPLLPSELAPLEDRSIIAVAVIAPEGTSFDKMQHTMKELGQFIKDSIPDHMNDITYAVTAGAVGDLEQPVNTGMQWIYLKDPKDRKSGLSQQEISDLITAKTAKFKDVLIIAMQFPTISTGENAQPIQYVIQAPDLKQLSTVLPKVMDAVGKGAKVQFADPDFKINREEVSVHIDREKAAQLGISTQEIGRTLQLALSGRRYGYFIYNDRQYEVVGQLERAVRTTPSDLRLINLRTRDKAMVSLDNLVRLDERVSPSAIYRYDQAYSATIAASPAAGVSLGEAITSLDQIMKEELPAGFRTTLAGQSRDYAEGNSSLSYAFLFAILVIYLVLAAQFESLCDPLTIILTVPMALAGALISLKMTGQSVNIFSQIGIIMLVGLITKNGILIVEFANGARKEGFSALDAARISAVSRFRPILMTTLAMILGTLPIALSLGASSGSRKSLGIVVVGGLFFAGVLTLYVIPAVYSFLSPSKKKEESMIPEGDKEV